MNVLPFVVLGTTQLAELKQSLAADLKDWAAIWFADKAAVTLMSITATQGLGESRSSKTIKIEAGSGDHWVIIADTTDSRECVASMMFAGQEVIARSMAANDTVERLLQEAHEDLAIRLVPQVGGGVFRSAAMSLEDSVPAESLSSGRGVLRLEVDFSGCAVSVWLPACSLVARIDSSVELTAEERNKFARPKEAISDQKLSARVLLGGAELSMGELAKIKIGDVIRLDKELQDPLLMEYEESSARFSGFLGRCDDAYAFQVDALRK